MATLNKKLKIKSGSSTQSCNLYTTTTEAGTDNLKLKVDNTNVYASLTDTSNSQASKGRIKKNGTTKAIAISGKPPYTEKSWTTAGSYTFTVPTGVTRIRVAVCGGGGGGATAADRYGSKGEYTTATGGTGGTSSFGSISATGGGGGKASVCAYRTSSGKSGSTGHVAYDMASGSAGSPAGKQGLQMENYGPYYSTYVFGRNLSFSDTISQSNTNYGAGGGANCADRDSYWQCAVTGSSGGYKSTYLNVTAGSTIKVVVGAGGAMADANSFGSANNGKSGFVLIAYGGDI